MSISEIPFIPQRLQKKRITMNGIEYILIFRWNGQSNCWILDIHDSSDVKLLCGIPLITGANLLSQFGYLRIGDGVDLVVLTQAVGVSPDEVPTFENMGLDGHLYMTTP